MMWIALSYIFVGWAGFLLGFLAKAWLDAAFSDYRDYDDGYK